MPGRKVSHSEQWWEAHSAVPRCQGVYKDGNRCRREAVPGTSVCGQHGAHVPAVMAAAQVRVKMSAEEMLDRLQAMLDDPNVEAREKVKIAQNWLDRAGLTSAQTHVVGITASDPIERLFQDLLTTPGALADPRDNRLGAVVDADIVEEDEDPPEQARPEPPPLPPAAEPPSAENGSSSRPPKWLAAELEKLI